MAANTSQSDPETRPRQTVGKALAVLDLFDSEHLIWSAEDMCAALHVPVPTGYRYIRELVSAGLLRRVTGGFALGARIILLDYVMRQTDPLLAAAAPVMRVLAARTGCDCVLTAVYGEQILDVHREFGTVPLNLAYGRGRPRPLFSGSTPKVILATQPIAWTRRIYEAHAAEAANAGMGRDWPEFRATLATIRKRGFHISHGEVEAGVSGVGAPIPPYGHEPAAAVAVLATRDRFALLNERVLIALIGQATTEITARLGMGDRPPCP